MDKRFGGLQATQAISFAVPAQSVTALAGTFQSARVLRGMTALGNVMTGAHRGVR